MYCFVGNIRVAIAQSIFYTPISSGKEPGAFGFTKKWAYPSNVLKDENGKLTKTEDGKLKTGDTLHQYFTANCKTNVQGGYHIRYCNASKTTHHIKLNLSDGFPAYASAYEIYITGNKFCFKPSIVYPELVTGQKMTYKVTREKLLLYQKDYNKSTFISGYIDAEFTETVNSTHNGTQKHKYYLKGYFKTAIKS